MANPSFTGSRQAMQEILESFSEAVPEFHPVHTLPITAKFIPPHPGMISGYVDPRMFHSLENGYGMIPYTHMQPIPIIDPYNSVTGLITTDRIQATSGDQPAMRVNTAPSSSSAKGPSLAAKERRRERNKVLARKTRLKKKAETENLRDQLVALMAENERLKAMVEAKVPSVSVSELLKNDLQLPENIVKMIKQMVINDEKDNLSDLALRQRSFVVVNPNATDSPIVYASAGFLKLTGYTREECVGRNCRFLQGPETDKIEVSKMKEALQQREDFTTVLLNYHKDGTEFWNRVELQHLKNAAGDVCFIVGVQTKMDTLSIRVRLARERNQYNLRSRGKQPAAAMSVTASEGEDDEEGGDGATTISKNSVSSLPANSSSAKGSSASLDTKVSKALPDKDIDYHIDKRIRLSLKLEHAEKRSHSGRSTNSEENSSGNSPSTSDSQPRNGEGHTTADDLTDNSGSHKYFAQSPQKEGSSKTTQQINQSSTLVNNAD